MAVYKEEKTGTWRVICRYTNWTGSPSELAETLNIGMAANALTKYLNIKYGRLTDEYDGIIYENKAKHSGRRVRLTYTTK